MVALIYGRFLNMSLTVVTNTICHPSVLNLLPFTRNNAEVAPSSPASTQFSDCRGKAGKVPFPVLSCSSRDRRSYSQLTASPGSYQSSTKDSVGYPKNSPKSHQSLTKDSVGYPKNSPKSYQSLTKDSIEYCLRRPDSYEPRNKNGATYPKKSPRSHEPSTKDGARYRIKSPGSSSRQIQDQTLNTNQRMQMKSNFVNLSTPTTAHDITTIPTKDRQHHRKRSMDNSQSIASSESRMSTTDTGTAVEPRISSTDIGKFVTKSLPRPALRHSQHGWYHTDKRHLQLSSTNLSHEELKSLSSGMQTEADSRRRKTIKIRINDLPRSKTPVAENDPDKLNIQHVIDFLQSSCSNHVREESARSGPSGRLTSGQVPPLTQKRISLGSVPSNIGPYLAQRRQTVPVYRPSDEGTIQTHVEESKVCSKRYSDSLPGSCDTSNGRKPGIHNKDPNIRAQTRDSRNARQHRNISNMARIPNQRQQQSINFVDTAHSTNHRRIKPQDTPPILKKVTSKLYTGKQQIHNGLFRQQSTDSTVQRPESIGNMSATSSQESVLNERSNQHISNRSLFRFQKLNKRLKPIDRCHEQTAQDVSVIEMLKKRAGTKSERRSKPKSVHAEIKTIQNVSQVIFLPKVYFDGESVDECLSRSDLVTDVDTDGETSYTQQDHCVEEGRDTNLCLGTTVSRDQCEKMGRVKDCLNQDELMRRVKSNINEDCSSTQLTKNVDNNMNLQPDRGVVTEYDNIMDDAVSVNDAKLTNNGSEKVLENSEKVPENSDNFLFQQPIIMQRHFKWNERNRIDQETLLELLNQEINTLKYPTAWLDNLNYMRYSVINKKEADVTDSPVSMREGVKLSLRKERNKTRENTYMTDMKEDKSYLM